MPEADVLGLLGAILRELQAIREAIESRQPGRTLRHKDRAAMARILPVLAAHFPEPFAVWELLDCAAAPDALGANLRLVLEGRTAQRIGKLFQRAADCEIDGMRLRRKGRDGDGAKWQCIVVPSSCPTRT